MDIELLRNVFQVSGNVEYTAHCQKWKMITELEREADRMCNMCFSEKKISTKTTFTVEHDGCIIVVKNVPCWECPICGEIIFSDAVSAKLEELVSAAKKIWQEISVIDFSRAA